MAEVTIRQSMPEDIAGIQQVARHGWEAAYGDILPERTIERAMEEWYAAESVRNQITRGDIAHFVVIEDDEVIGYVGGGVPEDDRGAVGALYVDPDRWDEGIGTQLLERELDALRERGATRVTIRVLAANDTGRSFYESRGFEVTEEGEDDLFGETKPAVTYASTV